MPIHSPLVLRHSSALKRPRVAFITSHPIQYQVPVFRCLAVREDLDFIVLFAMLPDAASQGAGFGVAFEWDLPLLEGYKYRVLQNVSRSPSVTHFQGCDTPEIQSVLKELQIDVVVVNGWVVKTCLQTLKAARRLRIPCVVRGEANNLRRRSWWKRVLQGFLVRRYDAVLPIGNANREFYRSHGIAASRMLSTPYCVENERFARAAAERVARRAELRSQWDIPENAICYLYCGKFEQKKHPVELVNAFLQACQTGRESASRPIHLLLVGDGELRCQCEEIVTRHSSLTALTFTGFLNQTQIVEAYIAADILVLPSDAGETWGLVVNEAMAGGLPAIVCDQVGCASDLIENEVTGWVFESGKWEQLTDLFCRLALRSQPISEMAGACRSRVAHYSPEIAASGIYKAVKFVGL